VAAFFGAPHISRVLHSRKDIMERMEITDTIVPTHPAGALVANHVSRAGQRSAPVEAP
jgi:hypothetical protein